ncbi:MAG: hypothetical protein GXO15_05340, partial [Crenarchaeota archaeon]|nr:hypothetical protein [Thermoproteota archaeon]
ARIRGLCSPRDCSCGDGAGGAEGVAEDFCNIHECLEKLLGRGYKLYTGFAARGGRLLVYTPEGFVPLDSLPRCLAGGGCRGEKPQARRRVGIALNPATKTVREGLLYTSEELHVEPGFSYAALVLADSGRSVAGAFQGPGAPATKLGADMKTVSIKVSEAGASPERLLASCQGEGRRWLLLLASPALLDESPWSGVVLLDRMHAEKLFEMLVETSGLSLDGLRFRRVQVPKGSPSVEALAPGWCTPRGSPRKPMLHIPAGTVFEVEASREAVAAIVKRGLGLGTRLGWGTVVAACVDE